MGSQLKIRARFLDDRSNQEEWVSALFPSSGTILPATTCPAPDIFGITQLWSKEILISLPQPDWYGVRDDAYATFTAGATTYTIDQIVRATTAGSESGTLIFSLTSPLSAADKDRLTLHVCDEAYRLSDATLQSGNNYVWPSTADWSDQVTRPSTWSGVSYRP